MTRIENYNYWQDLMYEIAYYDWAVEGFPRPEWSDVDRDTAIGIRNALVVIASEVDLGV
jgi:hypothetical protein